MFRYLGRFVVLAVCLFAIAMVGCGTDDKPDPTLPTDLPVEEKSPEGMVLIPAGQFQMGSNDEDAQNDEQPVHTVHLDAFYMDKHEVTNLDYKEFILENPRWQKSRIDKRFHNGNYLHHWSGTNYPLGKRITR